MRLVQVAKALNMTGQQLRHELMQVNFGIKPTDREIPDTLAKGVLRFLATKHGISVNMESLGLGDDDEAGAGQQEERTEDAAAGEEQVAATPKITVPQETLHVLRKLSLDDVSKEAIAAQQTHLHATKAQKEEQLREEKEQAAILKSKRDIASVSQEQIKRKDGMVMLPDSISVKELAEKLGVQVPKVIQTLMKNGIMATITQSIDFDSASIVGADLGITVQREERSATAEDLFSRNLSELLKDDTENLQPRPPIVVVMGHVDHGKTALLDAIRHTDVMSGEAGGITQHIGAYQIEHLPKGEKEPRKITFLDTPGHEAFTAMRARGAQVTDIVILVVSAEDGVKPTTIEAINHAKEANVPILVAITKVDKERSDPDRVKGDLAAQGLQPEEWGGTTPVVLCSAVTKVGIDDILDHILLLADLADLKANPKRTAVATVIESHLDTSFGPLVTVIVNAGTLNVGDICVCGGSSGKVKALIDASGKRLDTVLPSGAARLSGLDVMPLVGDILQVVPSEKKARELLEAVQLQVGRSQKRQFADLVSRLTAGKVKQLKVVLKTDAQGSLEALQEALRRLTTKEGITVKVIHGAIGGVTESDVMMASASDGVILSFHVDTPSDVRRTAEREGVKIREYTILYEMLDEVGNLLEGLVEAVEEEKILGHMEVRGIFLTKKNEQIIGGRVKDGMIKRVSFRLMRADQQIGTGRILSLKHIDKDIKEAKEGTECGMRVDSNVPILEGDILEAYTRELKKREA